MSAVARRQQPLVIGSDPQRFWSLAWTLAVTDWKLRFYGSVLGYLWTLVRPFLFFGVIYVVFTQIAKVGADVRFYGPYVLLSMVLYQFFAEVTGTNVTALISRENLLRKMRFPRLVIPLAVLLTALLNLAMTLLPVFGFALAAGVRPTWTWLALPGLIAVLALFATGIGMMLSVLFVRYRDVQPIWEVVSQTLFYASPILYVATLVPQDYQRAYLFNPLATIITEMRAWAIDPQAPHVWDLMGGAQWLLVPAAIVAAATAFGVWLFSREAPRIAEYL